MRERRSLEERFWAKVNQHGPIPEYAPHLGPCWLWTAARDTGGYGQFGVDANRKARNAHRYAYMLLVGPIPEGYEIDHLCRVRHCVNPAHLEAVTPTENKRRSGSGAFHARKTHCPAGHPYDEANTYISPLGHRHCRICRCAAVQRCKARRRRSTS